MVASMTLFSGAQDGEEISERNREQGDYCVGDQERCISSLASKSLTQFNTRIQIG